MKSFETIGTKLLYDDNGYTCRNAEVIMKIEFVGKELVRCKDCKWFMTYNDGTHDCKYLSEKMFAEGELNNDPNNYCAWGEKGEVKE